MGARYFDGASAIAGMSDRPLPRAGKLYYERPESYLTGRWDAINPLNVPGAFYGADTDTCEEGPYVAPAMVAVDAIGQAFVWRQPRNSREVFVMLTAASSDPFSGYGADGDSHWTSASVEEWWTKQPGRAAEVEAIAGEMRTTHPDLADEFWSYLTEGVERDLALYSEFLATRSAPESQSVRRRWWQTKN